MHKQHNAWLLYRESVAAVTLPHLQFIRKVCEVYVARNPATKCTGAIASPQPIISWAPLSSRHLDSMVLDITSNTNQHRSAVLCATWEFTRNVQCHVGLHLDCSAAFHTRAWICHLYSTLQVQVTVFFVLPAVIDIWTAKVLRWISSPVYKWVNVIAYNSGIFLALDCFSNIILFASCFSWTCCYGANVMGRPT